MTSLRYHHPRRGFVMLTWETTKQIARLSGLFIAGTSLVLLVCAAIWSTWT